MNRSTSVELAEGLVLSDRPLADLLGAAEDGVALFELLTIQSGSDLAPYIELITGTTDGLIATLSSQVGKAQQLHLQTHPAAITFHASCLAHVRRVQEFVRESSDPAIRIEVAAVDNGTHSRFGLLARADAPTARSPEFPRRGFPAYVYGLLKDLCSISSLASATFFLTEDVGLVHVACNELIFRRSSDVTEHRDLLGQPVKLSMHPDYVCWDEDDNMYQLPGWPDWAGAATWFDNMPLESQLHVMSVSEGDDHFQLVANDSRYASSYVALLLPTLPSPRFALHPTYSWYWHRGNIFLGIHRDAPAHLKTVLRDVVARHQLESASPSAQVRPFST